MRRTALVGLFTIAILAVSSQPASAQQLGILQANKDLAVAEPLQHAPIKIVAEKAVEPAKPAEPEVKKYKVAENDSLSKIATQHSTTWKRLYDKNTNLENPDVLAVGTEITIPKDDEQLTDRPLPRVEPPAPAPAPRATTSTRAAQPRAQARTAAATTAYRGSSSGNTYTAGYCTWYVKNMRPDLPNNLGNAETWVSRAAAQGIPTGSTPQVGAAGQRGNHVVYVEAVNGDGTVTISEMNHKGLYVRTVRTLPASYFMYIYR